MDEKKKIWVREIMNPDVEVIPATATVQEAAKRMKEQEIGSVIIIDPNNKKPIGIITERDINNRVVAENKLPSEIKCKEIMSSPVITIAPDIELTEAMHQMATQHIKRLIVMEKQKMIGIISQSDILEIAPYMIEILQDVSKIMNERYKSEFLAGYCEKCGNWSDVLDEIDESFICENCRTKRNSSNF